MSILKSRLNKHFAIAAVAAGGAALGAAQQANADIVYSGIVNINIPSTVAGVYLNVVTGQFGTAAATPGWDVNPWNATSLNVFNTAAMATALGGKSHVGTGTTYFNLAMGTEIGAGSSWGAGSGTQTIDPGTPLNLNSDQNILGFRFINEANGNQIHYGWMRISLAGGPGAQPREIVEYAYEDIAGMAIAAGAVPAPGVLALLGLAGLVGTRRRRA